MVLYGKLRQTFHQKTDRKGGGRLLPDDQCTKTRPPVAEVLRENQPNTQFPKVENATCTAFKEYGGMPETMPLDLPEDNVTLVV